MRYMGELLSHTARLALRDLGVRQPPGRTAAAAFAPEHLHPLPPPLAPGNEATTFNACFWQARCPENACCTYNIHWQQPLVADVRQEFP